MDTSLQNLHVACLKKHRQFLQEELDPLFFSDLLFEEGAIELLEHDKVTEERKCKKQISNLLEIVNENKNDCFHFLLYYLLNKDYDHIIKEIVGPVKEIDPHGTCFT